MSEERLDQDVQDIPESASEKSADKSTDKKKKAKRKGNRVTRYFREMRSELKKVVWPSRKQIINNTGIALAIIAISAVAIWGVDKVAAVIVSAVISLGGN